MTNIGELSIGVKVDKSSLSTATKEMQAEMKKTGDSIERDISGKGKQAFSDVSKSANSFGDTLKTLGKTILAVFAVQQVMNFGKGIITLASNLQQAQISFTTMLGSADKAGKLLQDLSNFAKTTPFELVGIRENAKQLLAMGVANDNLIPTMKALGDVSAGLSVPLERLSLAYGQVLAKGRLQGDDLRQFTEAGVPMLATLATQLGKTTGEISKMIEKGQISAVEVTKAFQTMSGEGGRFANLMEQQSQTVAGKWSNLQDSINSLGESMGTKFIPSLGEGVDSLLETVNKYGESVGVLLADTVSSLTGMLSTAISGWGEIFDFLAGNTDKAKSDQISFGQVVLSIFSFIVGAFGGLVATIKSVGSFIGFVLAEIVTRGGDTMGIFVGVFSSAFSQIGGFALVLGNNIAVGVSKGINKVLEGLNGMIGYINKLPGVSISSFGKISEGAFQSFSEFKNPFQGFGEKSKDIFSGIGDDFKDLGSTIIGNYQSVADGLLKRNDAIFKNTSTGVEKTVKEMKKIDLSLVPKTGGGSSDSSGSAKKEVQDITYEMGKLSKAYNDLKSVQKELDTADQKYHEANMKRLGEGKKALNDIGDKIKKNEEDYKTALAKISDESKKKSSEATGSYIQDQAVRQVEIEKSISDLSKEIDTEKQLAQTKGESIDPKKSIDFQTKQNELSAQLKDTKSNIFNLSESESKNLQSILDIERARASLSSDKRSEFDYKKKIQQIADEKTAQDALEKTKFDNDQKQLQRQQAIYEFFQKRIGMTPEQLVQIQSSKQFQDSNGEEQNLILKLANELLVITDQKNKRITLEQDIATETQRLSDLTSQKAILNVQKLKKEYQDLIGEIKTAISVQQSLEASKSTARGFANGGYTGDGGTYDVAGVVHKGEYVLSQDMLSKLPGIIPALEGVRSGNTYDQSRKVEITGPINMSEALDFESLMRRAKFIM